MGKETVELVYMIDKSRSMYGKEEQVIAEYNELLGETKQKEEACYVTTCLFADEVDFLYLQQEVKHAKPLTEKEFYVEGNTALYDAIAVTFSEVEHNLSQLKDPKKRKVVVYVVTDGLDNASVSNVYEDFQKLIQKKTDDGWDIHLEKPGRKSITKELL